MSCENLTARQAQGQRTLWIRANAQFIDTALKQYDLNKNKDEYLNTPSLQLAIPRAVESTGTATTNTFTVAGQDVTADYPAGGYAAFYVKTEFDSETNKTHFSNIQILKVVSSDFVADTTITVEGTINALADTVVNLKSEWQQVYGISDVGFDFASADISTDTNLSGAVATYIPGKITANPSLTGFYMPNLPAQVQLERLMMNIGCPVSAIITRGLKTDEVFYQGTFLVKTFTDGGTIDGNAAQTLDAEMQAKSGGAWKQFTVDGDFSTATTIKEY